MVLSRCGGVHAPACAAAMLVAAYVGEVWAPGSGSQGVSHGSACACCGAVCLSVSSALLSLLCQGSSFGSYGGAYCPHGSARRLPGWGPLTYVAGVAVSTAVLQRLRRLLLAMGCCAWHSWLRLLRALQRCLFGRALSAGPGSVAVRCAQAARLCCLCVSRCSGCPLPPGRWSRSAPPSRRVAGLAAPLLRLRPAAFLGLWPRCRRRVGLGCCRCCLCWRELRLAVRFCWRVRWRLGCRSSALNGCCAQPEEPQEAAGRQQDSHVVSCGCCFAGVSRAVNRELQVQGRHAAEASAVEVLAIDTATA